MTGEEFLNKVREIKEIHDIDWDIGGEDWNPLSVKLKVVADNEEFCVYLGSPARQNYDSLISSTWCERVAACLLVNKTMELLGRPERFDVGCDLRIEDAIGFAMECIQELHKIHEKSGDLT